MSDVDKHRNEKREKREDLLQSFLRMPRAGEASYKLAPTEDSQDIEAPRNISKDFIREEAHATQDDAAAQVNPQPVKKNEDDKDILDWESEQSKALVYFEKECIPFNIDDQEMNSPSMLRIAKTVAYNCIAVLGWAFLSIGFIFKQPDWPVWLNMLAALGAVLLLYITIMFMFTARDFYAPTLETKDMSKVICLFWALSLQRAPGSKRKRMIIDLVKPVAIDGKYVICERDTEDVSGAFETPNPRLLPLRGHKVLPGNYQVKEFYCSNAGDPDRTDLLTPMVNWDNDGSPFENWNVDEQNLVTILAGATAAGAIKKDFRIQIKLSAASSSNSIIFDKLSDIASRKRTRNYFYGMFLSSLASYFLVSPTGWYFALMAKMSFAYCAGRAADYHEQAPWLATLRCPNSNTTAAAGPPAAPCPDYCFPGTGLVNFVREANDLLYISWVEIGLAVSLCIVVLVIIALQREVAVLRNKEDQKIASIRLAHGRGLEKEVRLIRSALEDYICASSPFFRLLSLPGDLKLLFPPPAYWDILEAFGAYGPGRERSPNEIFEDVMKPIEAMISRSDPVVKLDLLPKDTGDGAPPKSDFKKLATEWKVQGTLNHISRELVPESSCIGCLCGNHDASARNAGMQRVVQYVKITTMEMFLAFRDDYFQKAWGTEEKFKEIFDKPSINEIGKLDSGTWLTKPVEGLFQVGMTTVLPGFALSHIRVVAPDWDCDTWLPIGPAYEIPGTQSFKSATSAAGLSSDDDATERIDTIEEFNYVLQRKSEIRGQSEPDEIQPRAYGRGRGPREGACVLPNFKEYGCPEIELNSATLDKWDSNMHIAFIFQLSSQAARSLSISRDGAKGTAKVTPDAWEWTLKQLEQLPVTGPPQQTKQIKSVALKRGLEKLKNNQPKDMTEVEKRGGTYIFMQIRDTQEFFNSTFAVMYILLPRVVCVFACVAGSLIIPWWRYKFEGGDMFPEPFGWTLFCNAIVFGLPLLFFLDLFEKEYNRLWLVREALYAFKKGTEKTPKGERYEVFTNHWSLQDPVKEKLQPYDTSSAESMTWWAMRFRCATSRVEDWSNTETFLRNLLVPSRLTAQTILILALLLLGSCGYASIRQAIQGKGMFEVDKAKAAKMLSHDVQAGVKIAKDTAKSGVDSVKSSVKSSANSIIGNRRLASKVSVASACKDDPYFVDEFGTSCSGWIGFNCAAAMEAQRYSETSMRSVLKRCPEACGLCSQGAAAWNTATNRNGDAVRSLRETLRPFEASLDGPVKRQLSVMVEGGRRLANEHLKHGLQRTGEYLSLIKGIDLKKATKTQIISLFLLGILGYYSIRLIYVICIINELFDEHDTALIAVKDSYQNKQRKRERSKEAKIEEGDLSEEEESASATQGDAGAAKSSDAASSQSASAGANTEAQQPAEDADAVSKAQKKEADARLRYETVLNASIEKSRKQHISYPFRLFGVIITRATLVGYLVVAGGPLLGQVYALLPQLVMTWCNGVEDSRGFHQLQEKLDDLVDHFNEQVTDKINDQVDNVGKQVKNVVKSGADMAKKQVDDAVDKACHPPVGYHVEARARGVQGHKEWFKATIHSRHNRTSGTTYTVDWTHDFCANPTDKIRCPQACKLHVGDPVEALYRGIQGGQMWYNATIHAYDKDTHKWTVDWKDNDPRSRVKTRDKIRCLQVCGHAHGDRVEAFCRGVHGGHAWFNATIRSFDDKTKKYRVDWLDGDPRSREKTSDDIRCPQGEKIADGAASGVDAVTKKANAKVDEVVNEVHLKRLKHINLKHLFTEAVCKPLVSMVKEKVKQVKKKLDKAATSIDTDDGQPAGDDDSATGDDDDAKGDGDSSRRLSPRKDLESALAEWWDSNPGDDVMKSELLEMALENYKSKAHQKLVVAPTQVYDAYLSGGLEAGLDVGLMHLGVTTGEEDDEGSRYIRSYDGFYGHLRTDL